MHMISELLTICFSFFSFCHRSFLIHNGLVNDCFFDVIAKFFNQQRGVVINHEFVFLFAPAHRHLALLVIEQFLQSVFAQHVFIKEFVLFCVVVCFYYELYDLGQNRLLLFQFVHHFYHRGEVRQHHPLDVGRLLTLE